jgi:[protein-PII] uridylyltransferase
MLPKLFESATMIVESRPSSQKETFLATGDALTALAERTAQVDAVVSRAAAEILLPALPSVALLAVGGYGRRQLFPYSDIDLLLLFASEHAAADGKESLSAFLQSLWDSGLRVSHSVRTPAECAEVHENYAELNVSLLDQRFLTGDRVLYAALAEKLPRFVQSNRETLVRNLSRLARERHTKHGDTFYHLEPNVKEAPGGLRDYQLICWLAQLRDLSGSRIEAAQMSPELEQAFRHMARLRCYLHCHSGRDNNVLSFDAQDVIAEQWDAGDTAAWMREYYRHARAIHRAAIRELDRVEAASSSLLTQFRDWRSRLGNADISVHRERAHFRAPQQLECDPAVVLRLFEFTARHGVRLSFEAEQQIAARLPRLRAQFGEIDALWRLLEPIFALPHAPLALRSMHETGVLTTFFPELVHIECLVIRDFYHRYTVDEHTLVAIRNLWEIGGPFRDLRSEITRPALLLFALLFHDSGKGIAGEGHVSGSVHLAQSAAERIRMPAPDRDIVLFLIRKHLELSAVMQSRDVFDPQTADDLAHQLSTVERLKMLTLLTHADISAVNPSAMSPWRAEHLWQVYMMVYNALTRELETDRIPAPIGPPERVEFLEGFPTRYLRTHTEGEIAEHMALEAAGRARGAAVAIRQLDSAWQMTLVARDRPGLFAGAAGTLSSFGMNIVQAEAFGNRRGVVLDTFTFEDPMRTLDLNPSELDRLSNLAERVIAGRTDVRELLRNRPKPSPPSRKARIQPRVSFNSEASGTATLIEIVAEDRPGLLYDLASAISSNGANIEVVLIDTEAHKAIDVFYVTAGGKKLEEDRQQRLGEALHRACATPVA